MATMRLLSCNRSSRFLFVCFYLPISCLCFILSSSSFPCLSSSSSSSYSLHDASRSSYNTRRFITRQFVQKQRSNSNSLQICTEGETYKDVQKLQQLIEELTYKAVHRRGTEDGLQALMELGRLSAVRRPFHFLASAEGSSQRNSLATVLPNVVPDENITQDIVSIIDELQRMDCLGKNPDSVDGLPSLHINLISDGISILEKEDTEENAEADDTFERCIQSLLELIHPIIYGSLLPKVQEMTKDANIQVGDVFLRRYDANAGRTGISAHYDVYSKVTAVIALDDVAANGDNGLFTTASATCNHAAMRRYFPLRRGDAAVHTWDVLHGVDVQSDDNEEDPIIRTSLIVWFVEEDTDENHGRGTKIRSPWLLGTENKNEVGDEKNCDGVSNFVLASAIESGDFSHSKDNNDSVMINWREIYLKSAESRNSFALSRIGSLCSGDDDIEEKTGMTTKEISMAVKVISSISKHDSLSGEIFELLGDSMIAKSSKKILAMKYWLEAAMLGNNLAQAQLADELMYQSVEKNDMELTLLATIFFGLASQQGVAGTNESLERILKYMMAHETIRDENALANSPIVQAALTAMESNNVI